MSDGRIRYTLSGDSDTLFFADEFPAGTVFRDFFDPDSGLRTLITRGYFSFCCYIGVQADSALADLEGFDFDCHYGITFSTWGRKDSLWPEGYFWWGWDYAHASDRAYDTVTELMDLSSRRELKSWTLGEVIEDAMDALMEIKAAIAESEKFSILLISRAGLSSAGASPSPESPNF